MATKLQLIQFISEKFVESDGRAITKQKLDKYKKSELEEFIQVNQLEAELSAWLDQ